MHDINQLKILPKIEISFQDDFSGSQREYTVTPKYIFGILKKNGLNPKIGSKILLWEKDEYENNEGNYICNIGMIKKLKNKSVGTGALVDDLFYIEDNPVFVEIDRHAFFNLPLNSPIF